ncbi:MAG TPA: hypothetical protein VF202_14820 [Trueperaceae bacterium]|jgi:hypothetical protein
MNLWLVYVIAVLAFALGYATGGRLSESEYDAKLRADWNERQRLRAEARLQELEGRS